MSGVPFNTRATRAAKSSAPAGAVQMPNAKTVATKTVRMSGTCGCEKQILIVEAEIRNGGNRLHRDALDVALGSQCKRHVGSFDVRVVEARDEGVVLPVLEFAAHVGRVGEI